MQYLNHQEFASLLDMAQSTFCDKVKIGVVPRHCKMMTASRGAKGKLWSAMKVENYMFRLIEKLKKLKSEGYFQDHNNALGFARPNALRILKKQETEVNELNNFELFMQISSKLNKGIQL